MAETGRLVRIEEKMNGVKYSEILDENLPRALRGEGSQRPEAHRQDNLGAASGQVSECA